MAAKSEILEVLRLLGEYYNRKPSTAQEQVYLRLLGDLEAPALRQAAYLWMAKSPFFPKVNELRAEAEAAAAQPEYDPLGAQAEALEAAFYHQGRLDADAWLALAEQLERVGRVHRAERVRQRLARLQEMRG